MSRAGPEGLPRRFLRPLLLLSVRRHGRSYGYELAESVRAFGLPVDLAGVYRDLRTMERHDLVTSTWEPSDSGPRRRVYELSPAGRDAAVEAEAALASMRELLSAALDGLAIEDGSTVSGGG